MSSRRCGLCAAASVATLVPWASGQGPVITDLGVIPGCTKSRAGAVSADGSAAAGFCYGTSFAVPRAFRWTTAQGMEDLGVLSGWLSSEALGISGDGSIVVGYSGDYSYSSNRVASRWTAGTGLQQLSPGSSIARAVSGDGTTVVGSANGQAARWIATGLATLGTGATAANHVSGDGLVIVGAGSNSQAFRWTAAAGVQYLGTLPGDSYSYATATNSDGSVVVGVSGTPMSGFPGGSAFRWTVNGMRNIGVGGGPLRVIPTCVNADGSIIAGYWEVDLSLWSPFIWTEELGLMDARVLFQTMGVNLTGWNIRQIKGMSPSGSAIVGWGTHSSQERGFVITGLPGAVCYANCDGSTAQPLLTVSDFACFVASFAAGSGYANCDQSTTPPTLNVFDFICFLNRFAAGCR